jgi:mannose-6-phosphate isomerase-like protein (cupin superfamily)
MQALKDASTFYEVERRQFHAERPGFRINELQISPTQKVPWHFHTHVQDTFYVLEGCIRIFLQDPKESVALNPGETYPVRPRSPHLVTNAGDGSATFLVLQGIGEYDFVPLVPKRETSS